MPVKVEAFLDLEASLTSRLYNAWRDAMAGPIRDIAELVEEGEYTQAYNQISQLDAQPVFDEQRRYIALAGMQAALYGAANYAQPSRTKLYDQGRPEVLDSTTELLVRLLGTQLTEGLKRYLVQLVAHREAAATEATYKQVHKSEAVLVQKQPGPPTKDFVRDFVSSVDDAGEAMIHFGSSLHTSRLGAWGFLTESVLRGVTSYKVSEQMDSRTCPVCRVMHGKAFHVSSAYIRLESQLSITDPEELKAVAKFPSSSKAGVTTLEGMSGDDLVSKGWDTPPYHPRCRGILRKTDQVPEVEKLPPKLPPHAPAEPPLAPPPVAPDAAAESLFDEVSQRLREQDRFMKGTTVNHFKEGLQKLIEAVKDKRLFNVLPRIGVGNKHLAAMFGRKTPPKHVGGAYYQGEITLRKRTSYEHYPGIFVHEYGHYLDFHLLRNHNLTNKNRKLGRADLRDEWMDRKQAIQESWTNEGKGNFDPIRMWNRVMPHEAPSPYSMHDLDEWFAECFRIHVTGSPAERRRLDMFAPKTKAFIDDILDGKYQWSGGD